MKRKLFIIIFIIAILTLLVGGGILLRKISIQRQEHIDELMQMELPDIVFVHIYKDSGWDVYYECVIDKNGNVYYTEMDINYPNGRELDDGNWTIINQVDEIELREKYAIFLDLVNMPDYRKTPEYAYVSIDEMLDIYWNGFYLEDGKRVAYEFFRYPKDAEYTVVDERGVELAEWVNEQTGLVGERRSKSLFDK